MKYLKRIWVVLLTAVFTVAVAVQAAAAAERTIEVTAHRGDQSSAPENTIPAFEAAAIHGAKWVEVDVAQTKDGVLVVLHDRNLKRLAGVDKNIWDLTYEELMALDVGSFYSPEFAGTKVPTLKQVIDTCRDRLKLNIEVKYNEHESQDFIAKVVQLIDQENIKDQCIITSFYYDYVKQVKNLAPDLRSGLITANAAINFSDYPEADLFSLNYKMIDKNVVSGLHHMEKQVYVWTVNSYPDLKNCIDAGVDNIITDNPAYARQIIRNN